MSKTTKKTPKLPKAPLRKSSSNGSDGNWRGIFLFTLFAVVILFIFWMYQASSATAIRELSFNEFNKLLQEKRVHDVTLWVDLSSGTRVLKGQFSPDAAVLGITNVPAEVKMLNYRVPVDLAFKTDLDKYLAENGFSNVSQKMDNNYFGQTLIGLMPILLLVLLMYFFFRQQIKMAGKSAFSFGKSKAKLLSKDKNKITFKDIAGIEEAKEEVQEIVNFLSDPKRFQKLGGRIPKGVLMVGPPGTGKTLLAKAIAGEADVPFYGISGSDFVEMFVGVGASRVRDMFEQAKKTAPCLIFIDEIDAVGRSRGHGLGGGHDEREQTLNALLVEMDGIDSTEGIIIIAATNRKDVLDPALLRPGRFDREVHINLPDVRGRQQILEVHAKKVKVDESVRWEILARGTPGFSGAELANVINEAALLAARRDADAIQQADLEEARDKVRWGRERRSLAMGESEKRNTAYHEAGHAILNILLEHTDPLHKVSIIPRGPALGVTMSLPESDVYSYGKRRMVDKLCMIMGGRVAEEIFLSDVCSGAAGDIKQATWLAKKMVCEWGMSEKLGMVEYGDHEDYVFLGRDLGRSRGYSEATAREIDAEVLHIVNNAYQRACDLIKTHKTQTEAIALALLEYETLDGEQVKEIVEHGEMKNPPPKNVESPVLSPPKEKLSSVPSKDRDKPDDGLMPGLAPANA